MTKYLTIKEAFAEQNTEKMKTCQHLFVDGYDAPTSEVYKRCSYCGKEKDRREISMEDAEKYIGVKRRLKAKKEE